MSSYTLRRQKTLIVWILFFFTVFVISAGLYLISFWITGSADALANTATTTAIQATAEYGAQQFHIQLTAQALQIGAGQ